MVITAPIHPKALELARTRRDLTISELAREIGKMDPNINVSSLRARLDRIEHGRGSEVDRVVVAMLVRFFDLSEGDLAEPPMWTWAAANGEFQAMAFRWLMFTTQARAYDARDQLAVIPGFLSGAELVPVLAGEVRRFIAYNFGELPEHQRAPLLVVDPSEQELRQLVVATVAIYGAHVQAREGAAEVLAELAVKGESASVLSLDSLYELAVRRRVEGERNGVSAEIAERLARDEARAVDAAIAYRRERDRLLAN